MTQRDVGTSAAGAPVYARGTPRLQALLRDLLVQFGILICLIVPPTIIANRTLLRVLAPVCLVAFFLYEPLLIAIRGATVGHRSRNLRVVRARTFARVSFPRALLRTLVKASIGVPAFVAMYFTPKHQALHDLAADTVVIPYDPLNIYGDWFDPERPVDERAVLPSAGRRVAVIAVHVILFFVLAFLPVPLFVSMDCLEHDLRCTRAENLVGNLTATAFVFGAVALVLAGWHGLLWGAQRSTNASPRLERAS